jgi:hypothetical protein
MSSRQSNFANLSPRAAPLLTVLTPGSLTVAQRSAVSQQLFDVPSLDLSSSSSQNSLGSLDLFDIAPLIGEQVTAQYNGPSRALKAIIYQTVYSGTILEAGSPCGPNCTYSQTFLAPTFKCEDIDLYDPNAPWCFPYNAVPNGTCVDPMSLDIIAVPYYASNSTTTDNSTDGLLWVKYSHYDSDVLGPQDANQMPLPPAQQNISFKCEFWQSRYDIQRKFVDSKQEYTVNLT